MLSDRLFQEEGWPFTRDKIARKAFDDETIVALKTGRSPSDGAAISVNFLSQPFPE